MKILKVFLFVALLTTTQIYSQITLQVGGGLGFSSPGSDFVGETHEYFNGDNYGLSSGINFHGKGRFGLIGFLLAGEINLSSFSNDGAAFSDGKGIVEVSQKVTSFRVGPELRIPIPLSPITPYAGANLSYNVFSGTTKLQGISDVPSGEYDLESTSRIGVGINGGIILNIAPFIDLDVNASYNLLNLSGKSFDSSGDKKIESYKNLNDDKDPNYSSGDKEHFIANDRSISTFEIKATVMFGL